MKITIGVPVYNGASHLGESLACLERQTRGDFKVLVFDNCSTDETPAIVRAFCDRDSRFIYFRQAENRGPARNFADVLDAADTPYFMWRAHDDLSSDDFIEKTAAILDGNEGLALAASRVVSEKIMPDGSIARTREIPFRLVRKSGRVANITANLGVMHQSWFYGLWRRAAIHDIWHRIYGAYPYAWASDFLMIYAALVGGGIGGTDGAVFRQRIFAKPSQHASQAAPRDAADLKTRRDLFAHLCRVEAGFDALPTLDRLRLGLAIDRFTSDRVGSRQKLLKLRLKAQR